VQLVPDDSPTLHPTQHAGPSAHKQPRVQSPVAMDTHFMPQRSAKDRQQTNVQVKENVVCFDNVF